MTHSVASLRQRLWRSVVAALCFSAAGANAEPIIGLGALTNSLVFFDSATPGTVSAPIAVTGLGANEFLLGIDLRPADGQLVGITRSTAAFDQARLYTIDTTTGAATLIQPAFTFPFTSLGAIGIDFNPVPNALRLVSDGEANLRITIGGSGTVNVDSNLTRTGAADPTLDIGAAAYSNNVPGGIGGVTTLYDINASTGQLFTQGGINGAPSPNTGQLVLVGSLGFIPANNLIGFDISGATGIAFASMFIPGASDALFTINLTTGAATLVGAIGGNFDVIDITAATPGRIPEPATLALLGLSLAGIGWSRRRK